MDEGTEYGALTERLEMLRRLMEMLPPHREMPERRSGRRRPKGEAASPHWAMPCGARTGTAARTGRGRRERWPVE